MTRDSSAMLIRRASLFTPIRARRSFEEVMEQITEAIRAGDLQTGDRLPSERLLAARMGISRPTLREAIKILTDFGVIEVRHGSTGGMFIQSEVVPRLLLEQRSRMRLSEVAGVLEARRALEPCVADVASRHATEQDYKAMADIIVAHRNSLPDRARTGQFDLRFHLAIARATKNSYLTGMMKLIQRDLEIVRDMAPKDPFDYHWTITIHEATIAAMRSRNSGLIGEVMNEHLSYLERVWEEATRLYLRPGTFSRTFSIYQSRGV